MSLRRLRALQAMAAQSASPEEAAIARQKLDEIEERAEWEQAWADQQEHQRIADDLAARRQIETVEALVRRWERGAFAGMTVRADGAGPRVGKS